MKGVGFLDISILRKAVLEERYEVSHHAEQERRNDNLLIEDIERAILTGEIIEPYPDDPRGQSCLIYGNAISGRPVHVVIGFLPTGWCRIITVYVPISDYWEDDWKTRKRRANQ
ncbi:MAG: hypothetical protein A4E53_01457 [Pelotomaculum sp. PtaB.Bin104]|nr:MAG: hypothetical protein A4E53_01457 [Pelotomaculum sp. PtaB.Bin104]